MKAQGRLVALFASTTTWLGHLLRLELSSGAKHRVAFKVSLDLSARLGSSSWRCLDRAFATHFPILNMIKFSLSNGAL